MIASGYKKTKKVANKTDSLESSAAPEVTDVPSRYARKQKLDPLTEKLQAKGYFHKMRWSWFTYDFCGRQNPLEVTRFYKDHKLAIDIDFKDENLAKYKKQLLSQHNIKYVILNNAADFQSLEKVFT